MKFNFFDFYNKLSPHRGWWDLVWCEGGGEKREVYNKNHHVYICSFRGIQARWTHSSIRSTFQPQITPLALFALHLSELFLFKEPKRQKINIETSPYSISQIQSKSAHEIKHRKNASALTPVIRPNGEELAKSCQLGIELRFIAKRWKHNYVILFLARWTALIRRESFTNDKRVPTNAHFTIRTATTIRKIITVGEFPSADDMEGKTRVRFRFTNEPTKMKLY